MVDEVEVLGVVFVESWNAFDWLRAGFSARSGGISLAYGGKSLNLGWKAEDEDAHVSENRRRFLHGVCGPVAGADSFPLVTLRQVHSDAVQTVREGLGALVNGDGRAVLEGDGLVTDLSGIMLGVQVADCVPVLVADTRLRAVGAFHAGWRGTLAEIVGKGIGRMGEQFGARPEDMVAAIGPSIGPCCYAVGEEVRRGFMERFRYGAELFEERRHEAGEAKAYLNLWEANRRQLVDAGIPAERVTTLRECSACARDEHGGRRYFSHRAEHGAAGRMMAVIGVVESPG